LSLGEGVSECIRTVQKIQYGVKLVVEEHEEGVRDQKSRVRNKLK